LASIQATVLGDIDPERTLPPRNHLAPGATDTPSSLGVYRILRQIGQGGMGAVYEAEDSFSGQRVAVKVIAREYAGSEALVDRFRQEGRLASLIIHPRCVFVLAADEEAGLPYIVMELMPGSTLQELVEKNGPLPIQDAVAKILDVIEGLEEAHRLGVVHRDVKPSNCFLLEDGRVKIGDFGLAKSLVGGADLTKTGSFLGTLLYASPEQIKGEHIDQQTDVYSVAATLYFLLGGKAPFDSKDAAATLARTVSESAPSLRKLRPEVSPALEKVIRRGLERQPERRWKSLADFRTALARFVPSELSIGAMGLRAAAIVIDFILYSFVGWATIELFGTPAGMEERVWKTVLSTVFLLAYFTVLEGWWGATAGKWLLRLRVCTKRGSDPPGLPRGLARTMLFYALTLFLWDIGSCVPDDRKNAALWHLIGFLTMPVGVLALISTMRARNGYRGLHEFPSGTRVVRLPFPRRPEVFTSRQPNRLTASTLPDTDLPGTLGPFTVIGSLRRNADEQLLCAEDPALSRKVLLRCRPTAAGPLDPARRNINRPTRLRWLSAGQHGSIWWDAFVAPVGCPLGDLCDRARRMSWRSYRGILEQLTDELASACADGTLPAVLVVDQVWVQPNGRVQLLDAPLGPSLPPADSTVRTSQGRALRLVSQATQLALEGQVRPDDRSPGPIRAPLPEHAGAILGRIAQGPGSYDTIDQLQADLLRTHDQPTEVNLTLRAVHLVMLAVAVGLPLLMMFGNARVFVVEENLDRFITYSDPEPRISAEEIAFFVLIGVGVIEFFFPVVWVLGAFLFRGGFAMRMMGLTLVRRDGRRASRLRCAWRASLVWMPVALLLYLALAVRVLQHRPSPLSQGIWWVALAYLVGGIVMVLCLPTRSWQDRLAGTYLVPK
jgi:hypothetical protein